MYQVVYKRAAAKALLKMPGTLARRFEAAFKSLAERQAVRPDISKLQGRDGYRLRIGGWRALYRIEEKQLIIEVLRIETRGDIYK